MDPGFLRSLFSVWSKRTQLVNADSSPVCFSLCGTCKNLTCEDVKSFTSVEIHHTCPFLQSPQEKDGQIWHDLVSYYKKKWYLQRFLSSKCLRRAPVFFQKLKWGNSLSPLHVSLSGTETSDVPTLQNSTLPHNNHRFSQLALNFLNLWWLNRGATRQLLSSG